MDIKIEDVDSCNKKIKFVIPHQDYKKEIEKYYKRLGREVKVPGFRKGKVPTSLLEKQFGPHCYDRLDTHFPLEKRAKLMRHCAAHPPGKLGGAPVLEVKAFDGVKYIAANGAWLMLRGSGTEPILRIYAEAKSDAEAKKLIRLGVKLTKQV